MPSHALKPHKAAAPIAWPSFTGNATFVGTSASGKVSVYYDASLGAAALKNAEDLLANADATVQKNDATFSSKGGPVNVIVFALGGMTDGTGGADHMACDYVDGANIEACASFGNSARVSALFEAELSECSMGHNLCGESTGEALSRWCAMAFSNNALADFATAPTWAADGMANFVDSVDRTDRNPDSTGCGMAFISWLISLGHPLTAIAPAMVWLGDAGTFASLYTKLTGDAAAHAWSKFQAAVQALPNGVTNDDPFASVQPTPQPQPAPTPTPTPQPPPPQPAPPGPKPGTSARELGFLVVEAVIGDLGGGKSEPEMKADIQAVLDAN